MALLQDEIQYFIDDHNHDNEDVNGSQELRFDETETSKCDFVNGQPSHSLSEVPKALANMDTQMEEVVCASSVQVESQEAEKQHHHITTSCVWCGVNNMCNCAPDACGLCASMMDVVLMYLFLCDCV